MNIKGYEYIDAIARESSLSKAAKSLGISQPTLSSFLKNLESDLGYTLFNRNGRFMAPTDAGLIYLDACRRIIETRNQTYTSISNISNRYTETITLGATAYRGSRVFSTLFPHFYQRFRNVQIDLKEGYMGTMLTDIMSGRLTLAMGTVTTADEERLSLASQAREELLLCVPDYHPLADHGSDNGAYCPTADIRNFADSPFIMWGPMTTNRRIVSAHLERSGMNPTVIYESNNALLIDTMLQKNIGVGFLPASFCHSGQNRVYFSMDPPMYTITCVIFKPGHKLTEAQRYFIYLVAKFHSTGYDNTRRYYNDEMMKIYNEFEGN